MKAKITAFLHNLIMYDYVLFGAIFLLFLLLITLSIVVRRNVSLSIFLALLSFVLLFSGPFVGYVQMHKYLFKNSTQLVESKKLTFVDALVVYGTITNESKFDFSECKITASTYKVSGNILKDFLFTLNPFKKVSMYEHNITKGQQREFKLIVEPFTYSKDFNVSIGANCK